MNTPSFPYRPLDPQTQEIRLIQVLPLAEESQKISRVQCKLKHVNLDDDPEYRALSYVWGDAQATRKIILDDLQIGVTASLETVLLQLARNLRDEGETHLDLWVDAICVDQANVAEKTHQVSLMDQIYNRATQTIFWLGPASHDSAVAIECLQWLSAQRKQTFAGVLSWTNIQFDPEAAPASYIGTIQSSLEAMLAVLCSDNMRRLRALGAFFDRQWFRRVWVLQEAALSTSGVGMIGNASFDGRHLEVGFNMLCGLRDYLRMAATGGQRRAAVADFLTQKLGRATAVVFSRGALHLRQLLYLLANPDAPLEASDERDYIFALLGLATDAQELGIRSDYSKTWSQIRVDVARACLKHYAYGMEVLSFCEPFVGRPLTTGSSVVVDDHNDSTTVAAAAAASVPSWAPNWSPRHLPRPLSIRSRFSFVRGGWRRNAYNACGNTTSRITDASFQPNGVLALSAIRVDRIARLGHPLFQPNNVRVCNGGEDEDEDASNKKPSLDALAAWLADMQTTLLPPTGVTPAYPSRAATSAALWKTPLADRALVHNYEMVRAESDPHLQEGYDDLVQLAERQRSQERSHQQSSHHHQQHEKRGKHTPAAIRYAAIASYKQLNRRPFATASGLIGIGPRDVAEGDVVWVLCGAEVPFVLRRRWRWRQRGCEGGERRGEGERDDDDDGVGERGERGSGYWSVVGEAYVHGIMDGEATRGTAWGADPEEIRLV